jgi:hypothetical protein
MRTLPPEIGSILKMTTFGIGFPLQRFCLRMEEKVLFPPKVGRYEGHRLSPPI